MPKTKDYDFKELDQLIRLLGSEGDSKKSIIVALRLANQIMKILGVNEAHLKNPDYILDEALTTGAFKNQKMESWFFRHFRYKGARLALKHFNHEDYLIRSYFFHLNKSATKARISATTQLDENWEDSELTRNSNYKVGVDFFLNAKSDSLLMVISNNGNLRVLELKEQLSHTQREILSKIVGLLDYVKPDSNAGENFDFIPQKSIHNSLWEALSIETVNKSFYVVISDLFNELSQFIQDNPPTNYAFDKIDAKAKIFSIRLLGRILFLWFLRKKEVLDESRNYFEVKSLSASDYYENILKPLFFQTLNEPTESRSTNDLKTPYLNGGLFSAHDDDMVAYTIHFPDSWFSRLYEHLNRFNFTVDESSPEYEQVAIDPEMLGRVFENLLATINPETSNNARKEKGAFYTPRSIVTYMSKNALKEHIFSSLDNEKDRQGIEMLIDMNDSDFLKRKSTSGADLWGENRSVEVSKKIIEILNNIKILDPAVGSGAFPIGIMQIIIKTYDRLNAVYDKEINRHRLRKKNEKFNIYETKLSIIQNNLYGIDIEPMAIEIARLRAWLTLIIDERDAIEPLPNLELNFVCANSLIPLKKDVQLNIFADDKLEEKIEQLRYDYFNAHSYKEKEKLKEDFKSINQGNQNDDDQISQLKTWNPFTFKPADFFDSRKMFNIEKFDLIISNPPYIDYRKIDSKTKKALAENYELSEFSKMINLYLYFFELGFMLLRDNGILCYITPQHFLSSDHTIGFRSYLTKKTIISLSDFSNASVFNASTYPLVSLIRNDSSKEKFHFYNYSNLSIMKSNHKLLFENPINLFFRASEYENLLMEIETNGPNNLDRMNAEVFVASSTTQTKCDNQNKNRFKYLEASQVKSFKVQINSIKFIDKGSYPAKSFTKQFDQDIIYVSRMTENIRAVFINNNTFLGGKINVIKTQKYSKFITCLLNSELINFWFKENFKFLHMNGGALPINASDLLKIPLPDEDQMTKYNDDFVNIHNRIEEFGLNHKIFYELNERVYEIYKISTKNKELIKKTLCQG